MIWIERRYDQHSDIDYAVIHFGNGEFVELYEHDVDES